MLSRSVVCEVISLQKKIERVYTSLTPMFHLPGLNLQSKGPFLLCARLSQTVHDRCDRRVVPIYIQIKTICIKTITLQETSMNTYVTAKGLPTWDFDEELATMIIVLVIRRESASLVRGRNTHSSITTSTQSPSLQNMNP